MLFGFYLLLETDTPECYIVVYVELLYMLLFGVFPLGVLLIGAGQPNSILLLLLSIDLQQCRRKQQCIRCLPGLMGVTTYAFLKFWAYFLISSYMQVTKLTACF
ncbi:hypothetical protein E2542_SST03427 [Spatholobus suberectus]|nr:hypothetical protein E2542_SST03427 [Spatholobus suberectus]